MLTESEEFASAAVSDALRLDRSWASDGTKMQASIQSLLNLGPLPSSSTATVSEVQAIEAQLSTVKKPISDEEAQALPKLFGPDDCFGLAWTLLHLIESAPNWPINDAMNGLGGEWIDRLRERSV